MAEFTKAFVRAMMKSPEVQNDPNIMLAAFRSVGVHDHPIALFKEFVHAGSPAAALVPVLTRLCTDTLAVDATPTALHACLSLAASSGSTTLIANLAAHLMVFPTKRFPDTAVDSLTEALSELQQQAGNAVPAPWTCPVCTADNAAHDDSCPMCAEDRPAADLRTISFRSSPLEDQESLAMALVHIMAKSLSNLLASVGGTVEKLASHPAVPTAQTTIAFCLDPNAAAVQSLTTLLDALSGAHNSAVGLHGSRARATALESAISDVCTLLDANLTMAGANHDVQVMNNAFSTLKRITASAPPLCGEEPPPHRRAVVQSLCRVTASRGGEALALLLEEQGGDAALSGPLLRSIASTFHGSGSTSAVAVRLATALTRVFRDIGPPPRAVENHIFAVQAVGRVLMSPVVVSLESSSVLALINCLLSTAIAMGEAGTGAAEPYKAAREALQAIRATLASPSALVSALVSNHPRLKACIQCSLSVDLWTSKPPWDPVRGAAHSLRKEGLALLYAVVFNSYPTATRRPDNPPVRCMHVLQHGRMLWHLMQLLRDEDTLKHNDTVARLALAGQPFQQDAAKERAGSVSMIVFLLRAAVGSFGEGLDFALRMRPPDEADSTHVLLTRNHNARRIMLGVCSANPLHTESTDAGSCTSPGVTWTIARPNVSAARVPMTAEDAGARVGSTSWARPKPSEEHTFTPYYSLGDVLMETASAKRLGVLSGTGCLVLRAKRPAVLTQEWMDATRSLRPPAPGAGAGAGAGARQQGPGSLMHTSGGLQLEPDLLVPPVRFERRMELAGNPGVVVWEPIPPKGYVAVGCVVERLSKSPKPEDVCCVHASLVESDSFTQSVSVSRRANTLYSLSCLSKSFATMPSAFRVNLLNSVNISSLPSSLISLVNDMLATGLFIATPRKGEPTGDSGILACALIHDVLGSFSGLSMGDAVGLPSRVIADVRPDAAIAVLPSIARPGSVVAIGSLFNSPVRSDTFLRAVTAATHVMRLHPTNLLVQRYAAIIMHYVGMPHPRFLSVAPPGDLIAAIIAALTRFRNDSELQHHGSVVLAFLTHQRRPTLRKEDVLAHQALYKDGLARYSTRRGSAWPPTTAEQAALLKEKPLGVRCSIL